jgi:hypothetical protein
MNQMHHQLSDFTLAPCLHPAAILLASGKARHYLLENVRPEQQ